MTTLDTKALRALEAKATPAPWAAWEKEHTRGDVVIGITWSVVCNYYTDETPVVFGDDSFWPVTEDDAEFVSALRNAAPALLDAAEELRSLRAELDVSRSVGSNLYQGAEAVMAERDALKAEVAKAYANAAYHADMAQKLKAEVERLREALASRDLMNETLQRALGPDKVLEAFGLSRERIEQSERDFAAGKFVKLEQLRAEIAERAALRSEKGEVQQ